MKSQNDWDKIFSEAHLYSWPIAAVSIQSVKPPGGRNIYKDDKDLIHKAAKQHGYVLLESTPKIVSFIHKTLKGTLYD